MELNCLEVANAIVRRGGQLLVLKYGEPPEAMSYLKSIKKKCDEYNINLEIIDLKTEPDKYFNRLITKATLPLNPMPEIVAERVREVLMKNLIFDIDNFTGKSNYLDCTAEATMRILKYYNLIEPGMSVVVIGRNLGFTIAKELIKEDCTVSITHSKTRKMDLNYLCKNANIVISATGQPVVNDEMVNPTSTIIDVGLGDIENPHLLHSLVKYTPKRYGVGAVTTSVLLSRL
jgi:5,10-methylene-tetrahydrofolate dehydrogenase/methenyl tetrahydrofolate cyclohydrolase